MPLVPLAAGRQQGCKPMAADEMRAIQGPSTIKGRAGVAVVKRKVGRACVAIEQGHKCSRL